MTTTKTSGDILQLFELFTQVVTVLEGIGVDGFEDASVRLKGTRSGRAVTSLILRDRTLSVSLPELDTAPPSYVSCDFDENREALLVADLVYVMRLWNWSLPATAEYLRCSEQYLSGILGTQGEEVISCSSFARERISRMLVLENARLLRGVSDANVADWMAEPRPCLHGRSANEILCEESDYSFAQLAIWALQPRASL